jgi:hypothetical protein
MDQSAQKTCTAFDGPRCIASGDLRDVASRVKEHVDAGAAQPVLIFEDATGAPIDLDLRGGVVDVLSRLPLPAAQTPSADEQRRPGRPKLGVLAREVTLLPRHWEWLNSQPGGASVALRKLVDDARRANGDKDRVRHAQSAAYKFMSAMAGNETGFEEAARALFAGDAKRFDDLTESWPVDVRAHTRKLAAMAFGFAEQ